MKTEINFPKEKKIESVLRQYMKRTNIERNLRQFMKKWGGLYPGPANTWVQPSSRPSEHIEEHMWRQVKSMGSSVASSKIFL